MKAWHFVGKTLRGGSPIPPDGEWLVHTGEVVMCQSGLHASVRVIDALKYAPGSTLCRVELRGDIDKGEDKLAARERRIIWRINAEDMLLEASRKFALMCADSWDMPDIVRKWLETGDEKYRSAAWSAAWSAAESAAVSAAWSAARSAAWSAARSAAWSAAWSAARSAAESAWSAESAQNDLLMGMIKERGYNP